MKVRKIVILVCVILFLIYICFNINKIKELFIAEKDHYSITDVNGKVVKFPLDHISFKYTSIKNKTLSNNAIAFRQINNNLFQKYTSGEEITDNYLISDKNNTGYININVEGESRTETYNLFYNVKIDNNKNNFNKLLSSDLNVNSGNEKPHFIKAGYATIGKSSLLNDTYQISTHFYEKGTGTNDNMIIKSKNPDLTSTITGETPEEFIKALELTNERNQMIEIQKNYYDKFVNLNNLINDDNFSLKINEKINEKKNEIFYVDFYIRVNKIGSNTGRKKLQINLQHNSSECYLKIENTPIMKIPDDNKNEIIYDFKQGEVGTRILIFMNNPTTKPNITFTISNISYKTITDKLSEYQNRLTTLNGNLKETTYITKPFEDYIKIDRLNVENTENCANSISSKLRIFTDRKKEIFGDNINIDSEAGPSETEIGISFTKSNNTLTANYDLYNIINSSELYKSEDINIKQIIEDYKSWEERNEPDKAKRLSNIDLKKDFEENKLHLDLPSITSKLKPYEGYKLNDITDTNKLIDNYKHTEKYFLNKIHPFHLQIEIPKFEDNNKPPIGKLYTYFLYPQSKARTEKILNLNSQNNATKIKNNINNTLFNLDTTKKEVKLFLDDNTELITSFSLEDIKNTPDMDSLVRIVRDYLQLLRVNIYRLYDLLTNNIHTQFMVEFSKTVSAEGLLGIFNENQKKIYKKIAEAFEIYNIKLPEVQFINDNYIKFTTDCFKDIEKLGESSYIRSLIIQFVNKYIDTHITNNLSDYETNETNLKEIKVLKNEIIELQKELEGNGYPAIEYYQKVAKIDSISINNEDVIANSTNDITYKYLIELTLDDDSKEYHILENEKDKKNIDLKKFNINEILFTVIKELTKTELKNNYEFQNSNDENATKTLSKGSQRIFLEVDSENRCNIIHIDIDNKKKYIYLDTSPAISSNNIDNCTAENVNDYIELREDFEPIQGNFGSNSADSSQDPSPDSDGSTGAPPDDSSGRPVDSDDSSGRPVDSDESSGRPVDSDDSSGRPVDSEESSGRPVDSDNSSGRPVDSDESSGEPIDSNQSSGEPIDSKLNTNNVNEEDKDLMEIINKMMDMYKSLSDKVLRTGTDNSDKMVKDLALFESLTQFYEQQKGSENEHIKFMKQLLLMTNQKLTEILGNLTNTNKSQNQSNYMQKPHLPNISQFKPSGTSNIFSPIIDIKTGSARNNERMAESIRKGYSDFNQESKNINPVSIDGSTRVQNTETQINQDIDQNILQTVDQSFESNKVFNPSQNINLKNTKNKSEEGYMNTKQGIRRGTNEPLGIPGYTYIDPNLWDIPKKRNPVCINQNTMKQGEDAINPAGYLGSGVSNVMEFQGVGSILPKFKYQEDLEHVSDCNKKY